MANEKSTIINRIYRNRIFRNIAPNIDLLKSGYKLKERCPYCKANNLNVTHIRTSVKIAFKYIIRIVIKCNNRGCKNTYEGAISYDCENGHTELIRIPKNILGYKI